MKKSLLLTAIILVVGTLTMSTAAWALNLRFNVQYSPKHPLCTEAFAPWAKQVAEVTGGRVKVTMFYSNALFDPKQALDSVASRAADIGTVLPSYSRNRLLTAGVMDLPMVAGEKAEVNSEVLWTLYQTFPEMQKELESVEVLWAYMNPAFQLHFTKKQVANLSDLANTVISAGGSNQSEIIKLLEASAEAMPMTDVYLAMQKGVVEGCFLPYAPLRTQKIADLLHYHTNANLMAVSFFTVINKSAWEKISAEDQKAIRVISGMTAAVKCGRVFDTHQEIDTAWMRAKGDAFVTLTPEQRKDWANKILPIRDTWVADAKAKGYQNPEGILATALEQMEAKDK
jgi:TRAP-type C4-dicarboxylate transport system substrate-binding protein